MPSAHLSYLFLKEGITERHQRRVGLVLPHVMPVQLAAYGCGTRSWRSVMVVP